MYGYSVLQPETAIAFAALTAPALRPLLRETGPDGAVVAVGATFRGRPAGLALAEIVSAEREAILQEIHVAAPYRRVGIGTALLGRLEQALRERGCTLVQATYEVGEHVPALEGLFRKSGWVVAADGNAVVVEIGDEVRAAPWVEESRLPDGFSFFPWVELTSDERAALEQSLQGEAWYPEWSPFIVPHERVEPAGSLGVRYQDQIVGWIISERVGPDTTYISTVFARPELKGSSVGRCLIVELIKRQTAAGIRTGLMNIKSTNAVMLHLAERLLAPYARLWVEQRESIKRF